MKQAFAQARRSALTLLVFALICTALLAGSHALTQSTVEQNQLAARQLLVGQTLPAGSYDNTPAQSIIHLAPAVARQLNQSDAANVYIARKQGQVVAYVFEATAPNGYSGNIRLLVGVYKNGSVSGVRVVSHKETPGLGDYIDSVQSSWANQFTGKILTDEHSWKVKKDGGQFDYMTGATISARAVTGAVGNVLSYYRDNTDQLNTMSRTVK